MTDTSPDLLFNALSSAAENVYVFKYDVEKNDSQWSQNAIDYFVFPEDYRTHILSVWIERIHPDDRATYETDLQLVLDGLKTRHHAQYRVKNKYGNYVWVECNGSISEDDTQKQKIFAGIITRLDFQAKYDHLTKKRVIHQFYVDADITVPSHIILVGMDSFRKVIHNYGYESGNWMLCTLADLLDEQKPNQRVYRMNGDEFLLIYPSTSKKEVRAFCNSILKQFQKICEEHGYTKNITFCCAADLYQPKKIEKTEIVKRLELAMVHAKALGPAHFVFFTGEIEKESNRLAQIEKELERSIVEDYKGFKMYYQLIVDAKTKQVSTVEALLRFHSDTLGDISPVEFIPILERTRAIRKVGLWVMDQVMQQNAEWNKKYMKIRTGFNVSYLQLYNEYFIDQLFSTIERYGVKTENVVVELTESCEVAHPESLSNMFQKLMDAGIYIALDDFGMVNSNLSILRDIPVTTVKIDHSFVRTITEISDSTQHANLAIVQGIITMCKCLNLNIVVEGVETDQIAKMMTGMGAEFLQGYYFSKPLPPEEVEKKFTSEKIVKES